MASPKKTYSFFSLHGDTATIIGVVLACSAFLMAQIQSVNKGLSDQALRTDKLYEMFIDLIKEGRK